MITRRIFLRLLAILPFLRQQKKPEKATGIAFPLYFPDGLDGKGEKEFSIFIPGAPK